MNEETIRVLESINRHFYEERADEFNQTRERPWRGWETLFDHIGDAVPNAPRVLDLGCGNGRFARFLHERGEPFSYWGVDQSPLALEHARSRLSEYENVHLVLHDVLSMPRALASLRFDLVVLFGVLHHVPGRERRAALLKVAAERVASGGILAYTVWRFDRFERFVKKLVPWETFATTTSTRIDSSQLEPGDHIMTWGSSPAHRYCHAASDEEMEWLASQIPLARLASFPGDDDLNQYWVFNRQ